jgi:hypothetical protein
MIKAPVRPYLSGGNHNIIPQDTDGKNTINLAGNDALITVSDKVKIRKIDYARY